MTNMEQALAAAGVKIPSQKQRIWTWLKDNGPHSVKDLYVELKIGEPTVQAAVTDLIKRKMLRTIPRTDFKGVRMHNHYEALGRSFELLPLPLKKGVVPKRAPQQLAKIREDWSPDPVKVSLFDPAVLLEALTLSQARQVYQYLGRLFK